MNTRAVILSKVHTPPVVGVEKRTNDEVFALSAVYRDTGTAVNGPVHLALWELRP